MRPKVMTIGGIEMAILILGLVVFLGIHSVRIFADGWRTAQIEARGETRWKGLYTGFSILGLALLVYGFGLAREDADILYVPPEWGRSFLMVAMPIALVLRSLHDVGEYGGFFDSLRRSSSGRIRLPRWCRR